ncbi:LysR family transcriptional regulator, regulator for metE and metH [Arsukibacterium tuosuense]|uniref:LysR family transcriptional regulator, regulator for metE and metH n=1 Tax=Arsukibacterium tuosuense TaxID=1323745 RepID=A0A285J7J4_9GAMM|nr:LysR substrate-binding domain-containing protein [Arsukibacterium tuosuense]SNY55827.1 LysR family transcriptional regulator, regulator for metE and metH [Arsukibacterium tuosuense]
MIEIKHLKAIQAIAEQGTVQGAAESLCITQSALSHQLAELERRLGQQLFVRKSQPLVFSQSGQLLLSTAAKVLPEINTIIQLLKPVTAKPKRLKLCVECHACFHWLMPAVKAFTSQSPRDQIEWVAEIEHQAVEKLLQWELDVVLTSDKRSDSRVSYQPLFSMQLRVLLSPEHPLATKSWLEPADLQQQTLLGYPLPQARQDVFRFFLADLPFLGVQRQISQASQILQLVAANQGVAVLPDWMAQPFLQQGLIASLALGRNGLWRPMYLCCRQQDANTQPITHLIDALCSNRPESSRAACAVPLE